MADTTRTFSGFENRSTAKFVNDPSKPGWDTDFKTESEFHKKAEASPSEEDNLATADTSAE